MLSNDVLNIYHASTRKNYFPGAHDHYDLLLFDEFHVAEDDSMNSGVTQTLMAAANNTLLRVLDGGSSVGSMLSTGDCLVS